MCARSVVSLENSPPIPTALAHVGMRSLHWVESLMEPQTSDSSLHDKGLKGTRLILIMSIFPQLLKDSNLLR